MSGCSRRLASGTCWLLALLTLGLFPLAAFAEEPQDSQAAATPVAPQQDTLATGQEPPQEAEPEIRLVLRTDHEGNGGRQLAVEGLPLWQYLRPYLLLRFGAIYEDWDETNRVYHKAGFQVYNGRIGLKGSYNGLSTDDMKVKFFFMVSGDFASGGSLKDAYADLELGWEKVSLGLRFGVMKVPFLYSEMEGDEVLYFFHRPQYVAPYASDYLTDLVRIGMDRHGGAGLYLTLLNRALTIQGGVYYPLSKPEEYRWELAVAAARIDFNTRDWIHDKVRLELGGGYFRQGQMPQELENSRYAFATDARIYAYGAFVGGEWALQIMDDQASKADYRRARYKNAYSWAMGYQVFAGYSFPHREYEIAVRYQWWDPDDTNLDKPIPQSANQALRWLTVGASWWPINIVRLMANYTVKWELEAAEVEGFTVDRLKKVKNNEFDFAIQIMI